MVGVVFSRNIVDIGYTHIGYKKKTLKEKKKHSVKTKVLKSFSCYISFLSLVFFFHLVRLYIGFFFSLGYTLSQTQGPHITCNKYT